MKLIRKQISLVVGTILSVLLPGLVRAQALPSTVVCVQVKGLRGDLLAYYRPSFRGDGGFEQLYKKALVAPQVEFGFAYTSPVAAIASLATGALPSEHGVVSESRYNREKQQRESFFAHTGYKGLFTVEQLAPLALQTETLSDVLVQVSAGKAQAISLAAHSEDALASAGKEATAAVWIDSNTGNWCTSAYYASLPQVFVEDNRSARSLRQRIREAHWDYNLPDASVLLPYNEEVSNFRYSFGDALGISNYKQSPLVNAELVDAAMKVVHNHTLGRSSYPLLLTLTLSAAPSKRGRAFSPYSPEVYSAYESVDVALGTLIRGLQKEFGERGFALLVSAIPIDDTYALPRHGEGRKQTLRFVTEQVKALTNMYLVALYGRANWVQEIRDGVLYLNRRAVTEHKLSLHQVQVQVANFLREMESVADAVPVTYAEEKEAFTQSRNAARRLSGRRVEDGMDVLIFLKPHTLFEGSEAEGLAQSFVEPGALPVAPAFWYYPGVVTPKTLGVSVDVSCLAPLVAYVLRIRPPTGSNPAALPLEFLP